MLPELPQAWLALAQEERFQLLLQEQEQERFQAWLAPQVWLLGLRQASPQVPLAWLLVLLVLLGLRQASRASQQVPPVWLRPSQPALRLRPQALP